MKRISRICMCVALVGVFATSACGQPNMPCSQDPFCGELRMGADTASALAGNNVINGLAGESVIVTLMLTDTDATFLFNVRSYQMAITCDALPIGVTTGTVTMDRFGSTECGDYIAPVPAVLDTCGGINPGFCDSAPPIACVVDQDCPPLVPAVLEFFPSPCINQDNPDHIFFGVAFVPAVNLGPCPGGLPRGGAAVNDAADTTGCGPGQGCYVIEYNFAISADATGDWGVTIENPDTGEGGDSFIRAEPLANILFSYNDPGAIIHIGECAQDSDCDDGNVCTDDTCDVDANCVFTNNTASCDDGDPCTVGDTCGGGACQPGGGALDCDDGNGCTDDSCDPATGCVNANNTAPCDDGNPCTVDDTCGGGACISGLGPDCDDGDECTFDDCDPAEPDGCTHTITPGAACT